MKTEDQIKLEKLGLKLSNLLMENIRRAKQNQPPLNQGEILELMMQIAKIRRLKKDGLCQKKLEKFISK